MMKMQQYSCDSVKPSLPLDQLPKDYIWDDMDLYKWEGFWYRPHHLEATKAARQHFQARDDDVILASSMKTGATWLKALCFSIFSLHRINNNHEYEDPLVKNPPAIYVQTLETQTYIEDPKPDLFLSSMPSPRLFHTHMPYHVLPDSTKNSRCKIVYITRNPKDTLVSLWHFLNSRRTPEQGPYPFEKAFEAFSNGVVPFGPFYEHVLGYWKEAAPSGSHLHIKDHDKILFLKYEELKRDPKVQVKRLASFVGRPFREDDQEAEVDKVLQMCSLERLKNLEVNKSGVDRWTNIPKSAFFRRGVVGDWKNHFTPEMQERLDQITHKKLQGSGLNLETCYQ